MPEKLARQIGLLEELGTSYNACCSGRILNHPGLGISWERRLQAEENWTRYLLINCCDLGPGSTLVARCAVFERIGLFDEGLGTWEDWDWLLRYVADYKLAIVPEPQAVIYRSPPPPSDKVRAAIPRFLGRWQGELRQLGPTRYRRLRARLCFKLAMSLFHQGARIRGLLRVAQGLWSWPLQRPRAVRVVFDALFKTHFVLRAIRRIALSDIQSSLDSKKAP